MNIETKYRNVKARDAAPSAAVLIESLRNLGYSPETALADIIDNSIFANAKNVWIEFKYDRLQSRISITDDGNGMNEETLIKALRPGSQSPTDFRDPKDLGRFGLGLKTASFSQCKMLTVISKARSEQLTNWRWDIDYATVGGGWNIYNIANEEDRNAIAMMESGTMVIWENLDRMLGTSETKPSEDEFLEIARRVKRHLEMVFHRYLETGRLNIIFNSHPIFAWDPFLRGEQATQPFPEELLAEGSISVKAYILPHRSKLEADVWLENEERGGWDSLQGFYIYRNERLLLAADWLGFTRKKSHYKLARIMINLPNHLDQEWQIDIKKSKAKPPLALRQGIKAIAKVAMAQAEQIYRHRGKEIQRSLPTEFSFVWHEMVRHGRYFFQINQEHPAIAAQLAKFPGKSKELKTLLRIIEETVPGPAIIAKENEYPDSMIRPFESCVSEEISILMTELFNGWISNGLSNALAKRKLLMMEPFSDYPQLIEALTDE